MTYEPPAVPPVQQMNVLMTPTSGVLHISEGGIEILGPVSGSVPSSDFPQIEFPSMEATFQSQRDISSIADTLDPRENSNSLRTASKSTDLPLKSMQKKASDEEIREINTLTGSPRDPEVAINSDNSILGIPIPGTEDDIQTALPVEMDISFEEERKSTEIVQNK